MLKKLLNIFKCIKSLFKKKKNIKQTVVEVTGEKNLFNNCKISQYNNNK
jgi:hypothetical protein